MQIWGGVSAPSVRIDDPPPGEEAQVDFGLMGYATTAQGQRRKLHVLIVTLSMSRYQFVYPSFVQTVEALSDGLDAAWLFFGGVVKRVVLDNMSAAVLRADAQSSQLNPSFAEYAEARGFFVDQVSGRGWVARGCRRRVDSDGANAPCGCIRDLERTPIR
jgi:transposase